MKKKTLFIIVAMLALISMRANINFKRVQDIEKSIKNETELKGQEYPLWSGYIKDFYLDDRCYITYKEEGNRQLVIYCTRSVYDSLRKDYAFMIELAIKVKRGEYSYDYLVIMEGIFQEKYTYSKHSNGEWWITQH